MKGMGLFDRDLGAIKIQVTEKQKALLVAASEVGSELCNTVLNGEPPESKELEMDRSVLLSICGAMEAYSKHLKHEVLHTNIPITRCGCFGGCGI